MNCPFCSYENIQGSDECARCRVDLAGLKNRQAGGDIERHLLRDRLGTLSGSAPLEVAPHDTVRDTVRRLVEDQHHCAVVVKDGSVVGILTERDLLYKVADRYAELADRPVSDFMTPDPVTLNAKDPVAYGLNRMTVGGYRHIPIRDDDRVIGVVSVQDMLRYLADRLAQPTPAGVAD